MLTINHSNLPGTLTHLPVRQRTTLATRHLPMVAWKHQRLASMPQLLATSLLRVVFAVTTRRRRHIKLLAGSQRRLVLGSTMTGRGTIDCVEFAFIWAFCCIALAALGGKRRWDT